MARERLVDFFKQIVGPSVLMVYGLTGSLKSKFAFHVAQDTINAGGSVRYLDTEYNLSDDEMTALGKAYEYTPVWNEIREKSGNLGRVDLVVLDSIGMPALVNWARMNMKKRGDARLQEIALLGDLKDWAFRNKALVIVTTQPESEFGGDASDNGNGKVGLKNAEDPVGGKGLFVAKEIWHTRLLSTEPGLTVGQLEARRSRVFGTGTVIASLSMSNAGFVMKSSRDLAAYLDRKKKTQGEAPKASAPEAPAEVPEKPPAPPEAPQGGNGKKPGVTDAQMRTIAKQAERLSVEFPNGVDSLSFEQAALLIQALMASKDAGEFHDKIPVGIVARFLPGAVAEAPPETAPPPEEVPPPPAEEAPAPAEEEGVLF